MYLKKVEGPRTATLPDGRVISLSDLPSSETKRWVASRKAKVVRAIEAGLISDAEAMARWSLSEEELGEWKLAMKSFGEPALKATSLQRYRQP